MRNIQPQQNGLMKLVQSYASTTGLDKPLRVLNENIEGLYSTNLLKRQVPHIFDLSRSALLGKSYLHFRITHILIIQNPSYPAEYVKRVKDCAMSDETLGCLHELAGFNRFKLSLVGKENSMKNHDAMFVLISLLEGHPKRTERVIEQVLDQLYRLLIYLSRTIFMFKELTTFGSNRQNLPSPHGSMAVPPPPPAAHPNHGRHPPPPTSRVPQPPPPRQIQEEKPGNFRSERYFSPERTNYSPTNNRRDRRRVSRGGGRRSKHSPHSPPPKWTRSVSVKEMSSNERIRDRKQREYEKREFDPNLALKIMGDHATVSSDSRKLELDWGKFKELYKRNKKRLYERIESDLESAGFHFTVINRVKFICLPRKDGKPDVRNEWEDSD